MATTEITLTNFREIIETDGIVLIDWWAPWCAPCRVFGPTFEKVSERHADIVFGKVNTEEQQELASGFGIRSIPTLMIFRDHVLIFAQPGALPEDVLEDLIRQARALDMDDVRRKIAEERAKEAEGSEVEKPAE